MVARVLALSVLTLAAGLSYAQDDPAPATEPPAVDAAAPAAAAPPSEVDLGPPGDLVTLKGGRVYRGFQVVKTSSSEIELEVTSEVTIKIPRRQIVSIEYDDIDPVLEREKRKAAESAAEAASSALVSGQKVPPAIQAKLRADISIPPIKFEKRDLVEAIGELNVHSAVSGLLELDKPVLKMPEAERQWTFASTPGISLAAALEAMKESFPGLATIIRNDKLLITDEKTAREILSLQAPPPAPVEPAAPAPPPAAPKPQS